MRVSLLTLIFFLAFWEAQGQLDSTLVATDSIEVEKLNRRGIFIALGNQYGPTPNEYQFALNGKFGIYYKKWIGGITFQDFNSTISSFVIFPNLFTLRYRHAGAFFGREVLHWQMLRLFANMQASLGDMIWESSSGEDRFRDVMIVLEPNLELELQPLPFVAAGFGLGYREFIDLDLPGVESGEFSGFTLTFMAKLGFYQMFQKKDQ